MKLVDDGNAVSAEDEVDASGSWLPFAMPLAGRFSDDGDGGDAGRLVDGPGVDCEDDVLASVDVLAGVSDDELSAAGAWALRREAPDRLALGIATAAMRRRC